MAKAGEVSWLCNCKIFVKSQDSLSGRGGWGFPEGNRRCVKQLRMLGLPQDLCNAGLLWELLEVCVGVRLLREGQGKMVLSLEVVAGWQLRPCTWRNGNAHTQRGPQGLPWWHSGEESACQRRGQGFEPWSGKIPHAAEQLSPCATTTEPEL